MSINESHRCRPPLNTSDMVGLVGNSISGNELVSMSLKRSVGRLVVSSNIIRRTCLKMAEPRVWCAHVSSDPILLINETTINKEKSARAENISVCGWWISRSERNRGVHLPSIEIQGCSGRISYDVSSDKCSLIEIFFFFSLTPHTWEKCCQTGTSLVVFILSWACR